MMERKVPDALLVVITGPTASGKSGLAVELAEQYNGEIICADSRTIYKGMDVGTAKPSVQEQARVRHWLLDVARPNERFTVSDFQKQAYAAIEDIRSRGKIPFLVGGTGLYVDSVVLDFHFGVEPNEQDRKLMQDMTVEQLQSLLKQHHIPLPENEKNKRYLIRSYEKNNEREQRRNQPLDGTIVVALKTEKQELETRIKKRIDDMFNQNIVTETQRLFENYPHNCEALTGNIYSIVNRYIDGEITIEQAKERACIRDRQLVKRQKTWLKRHHYVQWFELDEARKYLSRYLEKTAGDA